MPRATNRSKTNWDVHHLPTTPLAEKPMKSNQTPLRLQLTEDGSSTIIQGDQTSSESYHSTRGALSEARYVFARYGLGTWLDAHPLATPARPIRILEYGLGTGLNLLATMELTLASKLPFSYEGLEAHPLPENLLAQMQLGDADQAAVALWRKAMNAPWDTPLSLSPTIHLNKRNIRFQDFTPHPASQDIVYFDAFSPSTRPELWTAEIFQKAHHALAPSGILVTYSASGLAKRALRAAGFHVQRLPGALGKHHMLLARKQNR
ncbi:MAG: hypothetical protein CSA97_04160 [Bacteroidetes bacterium]|nr:MAG: hypothetical protein CSA97_04160 [Bacteroidota bacterium]